MQFIINPGTGPVRGQRRLARLNLKALIADVATGWLAFDGRGAATPAFDPTEVIAKETGVHEDGRYDFILRRKNKSVIVSMPGVPRNHVRGALSQSMGLDPFPRGYLPPRLYVDGSSWAWEYAVTTVRESLTSRRR